MPTWSCGPASLLVLYAYSPGFRVICSLHRSDASTGLGVWLNLGREIWHMGTLRNGVVYLVVYALVVSHAQIAVCLSGQYGFPARKPCAFTLSFIFPLFGIVFTPGLFLS